MNHPLSAADSAPRGESPAFSVRAAGPGDAAALAAVAAETFPLACPPHTLPESIAEFIRQNLSVESFDAYLADPDRALFVAETETETGIETETGATAVGYTMLVVGEPADPDVAAAVTARPTAELSKVYVREGFHGAGLARELVAVTVECARDRGAATVWLGVNQENVRANRFYEKQGFALVGTKRFLVGARYEDDFVRELVL